MDGPPLDTAPLFGLRVWTAVSHDMGSVIAIIHRADGCDLLVERRRWWRRTVRRIDLRDVVVRDARTLLYEPRPRAASAGPGDDQVA